MNVGPMEIMVILAVALLVVGPARLPGIARRVGHGVRKAGSVQASARQALEDMLTDGDTTDGNAPDGNAPDGNAPDGNAPDGNAVDRRKEPAQ